MITSTDPYTDFQVPLPPVDCTPWCTDGSGHVVDVQHRDDQDCRGTAHAVGLTRHGLVRMTDGKYMLDWIEAQLEKVADSEQPTVRLGRGEDLGMTLTLDEGEALGNLLLALVREAGLR